MSEQEIGDDEIVFCRVPPSKPWFEPPDRISTANYKLNRREKELGLSVYRKEILSAEGVLSKSEAIPGSFLTHALVGHMRQLKSGAGQALNLDVIAVDDDDDPGHAEIRGPVPGKLTYAASKALRDLFRRWEK